MMVKVQKNNKMMDQVPEVYEDVEVIKGYEFALTKPVFLQSPKNKFWEVTVNGTEVRYRAGVLRGDTQHKIKQVLKQYDSRILARANAITKIAQKIDKGYFSKTAVRLQQSQSDSRPVRRRKMYQPDTESGDDTAQTISKVRKSRTSKMAMVAEIKDPQKTLWKSLEKGNELIEFDVKGNQLTIIRRSGDEQSREVKMLPSYDSAVNLVHRKQRVFISEGFKPIVTNTFLGQFMDTQTVKKSGSVIVNPFSGSSKTLTKLTDLALESNFSSYSQQTGQNVYPPCPRLGPPIDHCIKCLLAENHKEGTDPAGWIMSQKLDGVRCLWTGSQMYSRNGNKFSFPSFFTKNWPNCQLDGQIFIGRGKFSQTISAVKKNIPVQSEWHQLRYLVFDAPGLRQPFKIRIKRLEEELAKVDNPYIKFHAHRPCQGYKDLFSQLEAVNQVGGEGIMLRQPQAFYQNKRSKNLQKVKTFHDDQAEVIGYTDGTGRCTGWIGALRVRNGKGVEFEVGSGLNDEMRQNPPDVGSIITYKYQQFNKDSGKPRFPTLLRLHTSI